MSIFRDDKFLTLSVEHPRYDLKTPINRCEINGFNNVEKKSLSRGHFRSFKVENNEKRSKRSNLELQQKYNNNKSN